MVRATRNASVRDLVSLSQCLAYAAGEVQLSSAVDHTAVGLNYVYEKHRFDVKIDLVQFGFIDLASRFAIDTHKMDSCQQFITSPGGAVLAVLSSGAAVTLAWMINDYNAWVAFGTGGTPPNFQGYLKITKFRILRFFSGDSLNDASSLAVNGPSFIKQPLPPRQGSPPKIVSRTLPQRQQPVALAEDIYDRLHALPSKYAEKYADLLILDKSITEGRSTDAIYARSDLPGRNKGAHDKVLGDEIAHVHPAENSLHVWLNEVDTRKVVEAGWGLRFPLASLGMVDKGWTFVYAPRSMKEVDVAEEIVKAGIRHLTGEDI